MPRMIDSPSTAHLQDELRYNAAYLAQETPFLLSQAIKYYDELEEKCDAAIQEQDELIRAVTLRRRGAQPSDTVPNEHTEQTLSSRAQPPAESALAPMVSPSFVTEATQDEISNIEMLEFEILQLRQRMHIVERAIAKHEPLTPTDTAKKLKFLARLIADGGEVEMDAFAQLVEVGAEMLLTALGEVGFF
jgi:hypothetical protein